MRRVVLALYTSCAFLLSLPSTHAQTPPTAPVDQVPAPTPDVQGGALSPGTMMQTPAPGLEPRLQDARYELVQIDLELARLRAARPRLFWPIALLGAGGATAVVSGALALLLWGDARQTRYGWDEAGNRYEYTEVDASARDDITPFLVAAGVGTAAAALGLALFIPRLKVRGALSRQARPLQERRSQLLTQLRYTLSVDRQHTVVAVRVNF